MLTRIACRRFQSLRPFTQSFRLLNSSQQLSKVLGEELAYEQEAEGNTANQMPTELADLLKNSPFKATYLILVSSNTNL